MRNLTDIHNQLSVADQVYLEKRAEQIKIAEEEDAAGRIMARGFADELTKLAADGDVARKVQAGAIGGIVPAKPVQLPTPNAPAGMVGGRGSRTPAVPTSNPNSPANTALPKSKPPAPKPPTPAVKQGTGRGMMRRG